MKNQQYDSPLNQTIAFVTGSIIAMCIMGGGLATFLALTASEGVKKGRVR